MKAIWHALCGGEGKLTISSENKKFVIHTFQQNRNAKIKNVNGLFCVFSYVNAYR